MNINRRVENLLRDHQEFRDSDKELLLAVWEQEGLRLTVEQRMKFMECTTAETVTRARRALKAKYPASEKVDQARFDKYMEYKHNRPYEYVPREED